MINVGLFRKTMRDTAVSLLLASIGLVLFVILFTWAMLNMGTEVMNFVSRVPFIQRIFEMSLGIKVSGEISINILFAVCFTHGVVMMLTWTIMIATPTRVTAGEIERGTADLLLALPVTRTEVYVTTTIVWIMAAVVLASCPLIGIWIGTQVFQTDEVVELQRFVAPAVNFFCLSLAVGALAALAGSMINRRSVAVGVIVGVILVSVVLNFLEPFMRFGSNGPPEGDKPFFRFFSLLTYFRPVDIVRTDSWPISSMLVLLVQALVFWSIGLLIFSRKDIPTA